MKYLIYVLLILAIVVLIFNITQLNFENLFEGESSIALIGIFAAMCVIVLMLILMVSRMIKRKAEER